MKDFWLQVQLTVTRSELDDALKTSRRAAANNEQLRTRINQVEAASQVRQQALERAQSDLAFCGNIEKKQLWSSLSESKRRIITLQVGSCRPLPSVTRCANRMRLNILQL